MNAAWEEIETHAHTYHGFLTGLRWVVLWLAASVATVILIFARVGFIAAFVGGSIVFAVFAYVTRRVFLRPEEHEVEDMAERAHEAEAGRR